MFNSFIIIDKKEICISRWSVVIIYFKEMYVVVEKWRKDKKFFVVRYIIKYEIVYKRKSYEECFILLGYFSINK